MRIFCYFVKVEYMRRKTVIKRGENSIFDRKRIV